MADERTGVPDRGAALRLELFVDDLQASLDFYRRVLGFEPGRGGAGDYVPLVQGSVHIALNLRPDGYYWRVTSRREKGTEP
jgi:catechol 2,3-dioxygenase-like lactoylglutathione lyase family enzyme